MLMLIDMSNKSSTCICTIKKGKEGVVTRKIESYITPARSIAPT